MKQSDLAVFVGRFQPFHNGHLHVVRTALEHATTLLILVGSASAPRRPDLLPFSAEERRQMIVSSFTPQEQARIQIALVEDTEDATVWAKSVETLAQRALETLGLGKNGQIALVGCSRDKTSYYLDLFPQWRSVNVASLDDLSATPLRRAYFAADPEAVEKALTGSISQSVPGPVVEWLRTFRRSGPYSDLVEEQAFVDRYRAAWDCAPYPPTFVTADAVVVQRGHVLLIQRRNRPGRGLWALPGGFVESDERVVDAAVRELAEETGLAVQAADLNRSLLGTRVFDAPRRDMRGRVITHASLFQLRSNDQTFPSVLAADDAVATRWAPIAELRHDEMFSDHLQVITAMTALIPASA